MGVGSATASHESAMASCGCNSSSRSARTRPALRPTCRFSPASFIIRRRNSARCHRRARLSSPRSAQSSQCRRRRRPAAERPMPMEASTLPCLSASSRACSRPASARLRNPNSGRAASLMATNAPSLVKAAIGNSMPSISRCSRSSSESVRPANSVAAIRMAGPSSANSTREQAQVISEPSGAPKPRSRCSRFAPFGGRFSASCATCRRCASAGPKSFRKVLRRWRAEQFCADRIGPQDPRAIDSTRAMREGGLSRAPPVADQRCLATGIPHHSSRRHDPLVEPSSTISSGSAAKPLTALTKR